MENYPEDAIKSFLRIEEPKTKEEIYYEVDSKNSIISLFDPIKKQPSDQSINFEMDKIFTNENENSYIYEEICLDTVKDCIESGISYSFISYGETTSKKLDVLIGDIEDSYSNINHRGIFPRLLDNLIQKIKLKENKSKKISLSVSYFLIYNNNLIDLSKFKKIDLSNCSYIDLLNNAYTIKSETDIINKINKEKVGKIEDSLLFLNQILSFLIKIETNSNEHIYSRSHICIVLYVTKREGNIKTTSTISFILLNGSEYLYHGKTQKLRSVSQKDPNIKESLVDAAKYTLETQYTYETLYNCIKSVLYSNNLDKNSKKENILFSQLTTVLYNICFSKDITKIKFRIIGTIIPNTGFYQSVKDTLVFLFDFRRLMKKSQKINYDDLIIKSEKPSKEVNKKKDDIIFELENKVKTQKIKIDDLNKNIIKNQEKIIFLQKTYSEQINIVKKKLNFPGDISVLISGDENTKEAKFVKEMREYQDSIKRNEGNIRILEKKLKNANDEIEKLKNKNIIKSTDDMMINYYLSVQQSKEDKIKENNTMKMLFSQIDDLKKEINIKNKINEELKKEIENKNNIIFNLPFCLKNSYIINSNKELLSQNTSNAEDIDKIKLHRESILKEGDQNIKEGELNNNNTKEKKDEKNNNTDSFEDNEIYYSSQIKQIKDEHKKNIKILEKKYENIINDKKKEYYEMKSYMDKIIDVNKKEIECYKKEIIKYNEVFMQLISNYRRIFFSSMTPQCNVITLKNKKEEFDNIILNIDKEINHLNFPLLFKELESKNLLNMNITNSISNMRKAELKFKKFKNYKINEEKKVDKISESFKEDVPPTLQKIQEVVTEATNEGKILIDKDKLNKMSKEAIILHCLNLNKSVIEMENYLEKYIKYKKGFNVEEFENNINYKENTINELNVKINKLTNNLDEQIQSNYNNMNLIQTQNRIIDKLKKELLYNKIIKKNKNFNSSMNCNINSNILINENSTSSTVMPSINNQNKNNNINLSQGKTIKKSNSCFYLSETNDFNKNYKALNKREIKKELNNGFLFISSTKSSNKHHFNNNSIYSDKSLINKTNINNNNNNNISTNSFINNNGNIRPFSSNKRIIKNEFK